MDDEQQEPQPPPEYVSIVPSARDFADRLRGEIESGRFRIDGHELQRALVRVEREAKRRKSDDT
jgi:hypothetical protein